ncbi:MAG: alpha-mannosidase [Oscillospiraceae bacterium]|nr:alpha-mannosidase [Oscillospiraceae bacterium]
MFFTNEKLAARTQTLSEMRYRDMKSIFPMRSMENTAGVDEVNHTFPGEISGGTANQNDFFIGRDRYLWLQTEVQLPECPENCQVVGLFDFGKTGGGHNSGFESLLYIDGHPWQGVDTFHHDVIFDTFAGKEVQLTFMLWTGLEGGGPHVTHYHQLKKAEIGFLDLNADHLYYYARAITQTLKILPDNASEKPELQDALNKALLLIDWDGDFYGTVGDALASLEESLDKMEKHSPVTVHCVGHTHIDVAWLWRLKHTREKTIRSFSTALRLMEEFDGFYFMQSQPQLCAYIKEDYPELYEQIKARVAEGKWEADGGMWLEADCNVTAGESLVRQFLHGCRFIREEFGKECTTLWLPDVFGYSWALPQILKGCNIKTFMTTKISWNQYNHLPHDLFWWRGIDGTEMLTYFITTPSENQPLEKFFSTYNGDVTAETVQRSWNMFQDKAISKDTLISYGYGDGGGGANREMVKTGMALEKIPGIPHVKMGGIQDFFEKTHKAVDETDSYIHTWDGELYLEYHRGTYTSQARNKKWNRRMEQKLWQTEWLGCLNVLLGGSYPLETIYKAWETVLRNQFHDIIPGSSINEVYADSAIEYQGAYDAVDAASEKFALTDGEQGVYTVFNPSSFARKDTVFLPVCGSTGFVDECGNTLSTAPADGGVLVSLELKALEVKTIKEAGKAEAAPSVFEVDLRDGYVETPFYKIILDESGWINSIWDKEASREVLAGHGNRLEVYEDRPMNYDAWDIDIYYKEKVDFALASGAPAVVENSALRLVLRTVYTYGESTFTQDMILYKDSRRIDFVTEAEWHESHKLLKAVFPLNIRTTKAVYDIQYGHVERPTHWNTSWDLARFEVCGHKWAEMAEADYGVALLNNCKYGHSAKDNVLTLSLLKSAKYPDTAADMGHHSFTYSLLPHMGPAAGGEVIAEANALNLPITWRKGASALSGKCIFKTDSDHIQIDAVKMAEDGDGFVVRVHECRGTTVPEVKLTSDFAIERWQRCNLLEDKEGAPVECSEISFRTGPFGLHTFRVWMK